MVLPSSLEDLASLSAYYEYIAQLFEAESQISIAVPLYKMALEVLEDDGSIATATKRTNLWYSTFRGQLIAEQWEGAYMTIAGMPTGDL